MNFLDTLKDILLFNPSAPLIFTQFRFWVFLIIALSGYAFVYRDKNRSKRAAYLFVLSIYFYYRASGFFFFLLLFSTLTDFFIGKWIHHAINEKKRLFLLVLSITVNLGVLCYFKYAYFFADSFNAIFGTDYQVVNYLAQWSNSLTGTHFDIDKILLPVGVSFFTFQTISYSIDVYRRELAPVRNLIDFGFFVSFFPQLVAGPIVRASNFIPQIYQDYSLTKAQWSFAIFMIVKGLVKKILIGDYIAINFIDRIFGDPMHYTGFENLMALVGYSLQVYVDFSGYTDIAIGVALLFGFRLADNFNSPYKAQNVSDFWKRWHISLSTWLKDYLYIPLGGNRKGTVGSYIIVLLFFVIISFLAKMWWLLPIFLAISAVLLILAHYRQGFKHNLITNINLMLTMLIGGLWHGASWQFIIWGGLNGLGLIVYKYWRKISPWERSNHQMVIIWRIALTFTFISFTRVFFRANTMENAWNMLRQIAYNLDFSLIPSVILAYKAVFSIMLLGFVMHWLSYAVKEKLLDWFTQSPFWAKAIYVSVILIIVYQSISSEMQPFIYFQF